MTEKAQQDLSVEEQQAKQLQDLLDFILSPSTSDDDADEAMDKMAELEAQFEAEKLLPPANQRPTNEQEVCELLAKQIPETTADELLYYLKKYYLSIDVVKLIAAHPSLQQGWLARFMHYLPEQAQANPSYAHYSGQENWQKVLDSHQPTTAQCGYRWGNDDITTQYVSETNPPIFKVYYWLKHGKAADKRFVVGLAKVDEVHVLPLAKDKSAHVRKAIATRAKISVELATTIAQDKAKTVRQALAMNVDCPPVVLTTLSQDKDPTVSQAAMDNTACPSDAIHAAKLAEKMQPKPKAKPVSQLNDQEIIAQLVDINTDTETLQALADSPQDFVRAGVALHRNCPVETLKSLCKDKNKMVRLSVAFNPNTPINSLQSLIDNKDSDVYLGLASNPSLTEQQQLDLINLTDDTLRKVLADTTELDSVWVALRDSKPTEKIAENKKNSKKKSWRDCLTLCLDAKGKGLYGIQRGTSTRYHFVNKMVARHPKCPDKLKPFFAFYLFSSLTKNPSVALTLLENPNAIKAEEYAAWKLDSWLMYEEAPGHVVKYYLHSDEIKYARKSVLCWTAQMVDIQAQLHRDDIHMRKYMAGLKAATPYMFEILARDLKESVREAVVANPACPPAVLAHLLTDKVAAIRVSAQSHANFDAKLVADESSVPLKIESLKNKGPKRHRIKQARDTESFAVLRDLAGDKLAEVRLNVVENKRTPIDVLEILKNDPDEAVRRMVCYHRNSSVGICRDLFKDSKESVRLRALRSYLYETAQHLDDLDEEDENYDYHNKKYDESTLALFYEDEGESVRACVANFTVNEEVQARYAKDESESVRKNLARNLKLSHAVGMGLIESGERTVVRDLAEKTRDQAVFIETLKHDEAVASSLRRNHQMCDDLTVQQIMMQHPNPQVRKVVADRITDHALLMQCVQDDSSIVIEDVAYNEALTVEHLDFLLERASSETLSNLYSCHEDYLKKNVSKWLDHNNIAVRAFCAENAKLTQAMAEKIAKDESGQVRKALVENYKFKFTDEMIELLRHDEVERVRSAIRWRFD